MNILQVAALGIIAAILVVLLKESKPELAVLLGTAAGVIMIITVVDELYEVVESFYNIAATSGIAEGIFTTVLKIIGIGYVSEFSANVCADSGCKSVGDKILFAGKIIIMVLALPIITDLLSLITEILP